MDAVVTGLDLISTAADVDISLSVLIPVAGMKPVISGVDGEAAILHPDGIICGDPLFHSGHLIGSLDEFQVILSNDPMLIAGGDLQGACSVKCNVVLCIDHAVHSTVLVRLRIFLSCIGQCIRRTLRQGNKDLIRILYENAGAVVIAHGHTGKNQLHLILISHVHKDLSVGKTSGYHIGSFLLYSDHR